MKSKKVYVLIMEQEKRNTEIIGVFYSIYKARREMLNKVGISLHNAIENSLFYKPEELKDGYMEYSSYIYNDFPKSLKPFDNLSDEEKKCIEKLRDTNSYLLRNYSIPLSEYFQIIYLMGKGDKELFSTTNIVIDDLVSKYNYECSKNGEKTYRIITNKLR